MTKSAVISSDRIFRYQLTRIWDDSKGKVLFIMLNPSTADASVDDPTVRRCMKYAEDWGYGGIRVGNLFPFRSKEPKDLLLAENPLGEDNKHHLYELSRSSDIVICAWGNGKIVDKIQKRFPDYKPLILIDKPVHYLKLSKDGTPCHPLYLLKILTPKNWLDGK